MSVRFTLESSIIIGHRKKNQLCSAESVGMSNMYLDTVFPYIMSGDIN